jgi:hypothetical protein
MAILKGQNLMGVLQKDVLFDKLHFVIMFFLVHDEDCNNGFNSVIY